MNNVSSRNIMSIKPNSERKKKQNKDQIEFEKGGNL